MVHYENFPVGLYGRLLSCRGESNLLRHDHECESILMMMMIIIIISPVDEFALSVQKGEREIANVARKSRWNEGMEQPGFGRKRRRRRRI